jgi:hypothetical protein
MPTITENSAKIIVMLSLIQFFLKLNENCPPEFLVRDTPGKKGNHPRKNQGETRSDNHNGLPAMFLHVRFKDAIVLAPY